MKRTILVTGGLGFIGSAFLREYVPLHKNWLFVNLDDHRAGSNEETVAEIMLEPNYRFEKCALEDSIAVRHIFDKYRFTDVLHFAADSDVDHSISSPEETVSSNVTGTQSLLEATRAWIPFGPIRFLYVSTDEVYGPAATGQCFDEKAPMNPKNPYSASKAAAEHLVRAYGNTYGLDFIITRGCNTFGPWQQPTKLIPRSVKSLIDGKKIPVYGNGMQVREWIPVDVHASAIRMAWLNGESGETYNISLPFGEWINKDLIWEIIGHVKPDMIAEYFMETVPDRPGHDIRYSINGVKLRRIWEPNPKWTLQSTVQWYVDYWKKQEGLVK